MATKPEDDLTTTEGSTGQGMANKGIDPSGADASGVVQPDDDVTDDTGMDDTTDDVGGGEDDTGAGDDTGDDTGDGTGDGSGEATGTGVDDFIPEEGGGTTYKEPDMSAEVDPAADVAIPESTTGHTEYDEGDWTVAGQLEKLYDRDSPFFEKARQQATRRHLAAGGQNTLMAGAAGESAAMETAFKVGFADAETYKAFSQAEQKFIHNALLSDQAYGQARELQEQRIEAQFEAIRLDFKGKTALMDKELDQWYDKAKQQHQYALDMLWEQEDAYEGREQRGFQRKMTLEGMLAMSAFMTTGVQSVMAATANLKNAGQQGESMRQGMQWLGDQSNYLQGFWGGWAAGGPPMDTDWLGQSSTNNSTNWWDFATEAGWTPPTGG